jgi:uncharacterized alkaline shock family protein YloU
MKNEITNDNKARSEVFRIDTKEFDLPETVFSCNIDEKVFQGIILQCLADIDGISPVCGNLIDNLLGRSSGPEGIKGVTVDQNSKSHTIDVKIELNICYGYSIPEMAETIQSKVSEAITRLTGLHVSSVHIAFKNVISYEQMKKSPVPAMPQQEAKDSIDDEYNDEF